MFEALEPIVDAYSKTIPLDLNAIAITVVNETPEVTVTKASEEQSLKEVLFGNDSWQYEDKSPPLDSTSGYISFSEAAMCSQAGKS